MKPEKLDKEVLSIVKEVIPAEMASKEIRPEYSLNELGIDSLGKATMAFRLEEKYGVNLADYASEIAKIQTVGDILALARKAVLR